LGIIAFGGEATGKMSVLGAMALVAMIVPMFDVIVIDGAYDYEN
jgi:hypothetical protein